MKNNTHMVEAAQERTSQSLEDAARDGGIGDYKYPDNLDLRPGSELSKRIIEFCEDRIRASRAATDRLEPAWDNMERTMAAHMPESSLDTIRKDRDSRKPVTIVVPQLFAMKELFQAYNMTLFQQGNRIHGIKGIGSKEAAVQGAVRERMVEKQTVWFDEALRLDMLIGQAFTYGRASVGLNWTKKLARHTVQEVVSNLDSEVFKLYGYHDIFDGDTIRYTKDTVRAEGTELTNLDPRNTFYDPTRDSNRLQDSEYFGWMFNSNAMEMLTKEKDPEEQTFNGEYVRILAKHGNARSQWWSAEDVRAGKDGSVYDGTEQNRDVSSEVHNIVMIVHLIPEEWGLADSRTPVHYAFQISGDRIVTACHPLFDDHQMIPAASMTPNANGLDSMPISHLMAVYGLQEAASWVIKTRMDAVMTILNGLIFVDQSKVEMDDMMNPGMGKLVRIKNNAYADGGIKNYVHQMEMKDPTAGHMQNVAELDQIARDGVGAGDLVMGQPGGLPERPTKGGMLALQNQGFSRLRLVAERLYAQAIRPIGLMMTHNTQQYMSRDMVVPIAGRLERRLREELGLDPREDSFTAGPADIDTDFEMETFSGNQPFQEDTTAQAEVVKTMLAIDGVAADLFRNYDMTRIIASFFRKAGFEDMEDFRNTMADRPVNIETQSQGQIDQGISEGNLVGQGQL